MSRSACRPAFSHPERYYPSLKQISPEPVELLTVPLIGEGNAMGVIWIVSHDEQRKFDPEDARVMTSLADFLAVALISAQARQAAQESQRLFQRMAEASPDVLYVHDLKTQRAVYLSDRFEQLFDCTIEQVMQMGDRVVDRLVYPDDLLQVKANLAAMRRMSDQETYEFEYRSPYRDTYRWLHSRSRVFVRGEDGQVDQIVGFLQDVTGAKQREVDRQQAEVTLRDQKTRLRLMIESAKEYAIFTLDLSGNITSWNAGAQRLLGFEEAEIVGQNGSIVFTPEDVAIDEPARELQTALTQGRKENERWHIRKDSSRFWASGLMMPLRDEDNAVRGFLKILQDKTEQRQAKAALQQSEARLQLALIVGRMGSWDWDMRSNTLTWSEGHFTLLGLQPNKIEPSYEVWINSVHPPDRAGVEAALHRAMTEKIEYHHEYRVVWRDGSLHWTEARGEFSYDAEGEAYRMIGVIVDISDRKRIEQERERLLAHEQAAREAAEAANRSKDEFLAVLSHELRSPLNPILGWTGLLRHGRLDATKTAVALETIERNAKLQVQLIEDLLDISRILNGKLTLKAASVNLATTIRAALETVRLAAEAKSIQVDTALDAAIGRVHGDTTRLQQVVWNLLSNAIKFTPSGGRVKVRLEEVCDGSTPISIAQITVTDTGKGVPANFLPHVFEYFRQADSTITRNFGGLGLGLAIVRQIIEMHGGTVQVTSAGENQGATFTVQLPLMKQKGCTDEQSKASNSAPASAYLAGIRVLLVDDEADSRNFTAFALEQQGAIVTAVESATAALAAFAQTQPQVLISDIGMPEIDGYTLIQKIRSLPQGEQIFAIALTAYAGEINQQQAIAAGFQKHLAKPIDFAELVEVTASAIDRYY